MLFLVFFFHNGLTDDSFKNVCLKWYKMTIMRMQSESPVKYHMTPVSSVDSIGAVTPLKCEYFFSTRKASVCWIVASIASSAVEAASQTRTAAPSLASQCWRRRGWRSLTLFRRRNRGSMVRGGEKESRHWLKLRNRTIIVFCLCNFMNTKSTQALQKTQWDPHAWQQMSVNKFCINKGFYLIYLILWVNCEWKMRACMK